MGFGSSQEAIEALREAYAKNNNIEEIFNDLTEEARLLEEEKNKMTNLVNDVPVGIGIYEIIDGIPSLSFMNEAYYKMLGASREGSVK